MNRIERIRAIILEGTNTDPESLSQEQRIFLSLCVGNIITHPILNNPNEVEEEVDRIIKDLRGLRRRIKALDRDAKYLTRKYQDEDKKDEIFARMSEAIENNDLQAHESAVDELAALQSRPQEEWVDLATLHHLDELERSLVRTGERAISVARLGPGRRKNRKAHKVALHAARAYLELTGKKPTYRGGGTTQFSRILEKIYKVEGINAGLRGPVEAAMQKLQEDP